jgi:hypothetical protein
MFHIVEPAADEASSEVNMGAYRPLHQVSTRFVYQLEAGFSLCPPG